MPHIEPLNPAQIRDPELLALMASGLKFKTLESHYFRFFQIEPLVHVTRVYEN